MSPEDANARLCLGELLPVSDTFSTGLGITAAALREAGHEDRARALERVLEIHRLHGAQLHALADRLVKELG
jgi:hypothetical protein